FEHLTTTLAVGQALAALDLLKTMEFGRLGLMGSSFGGLVSILTAAQQRDLRCLALKCPVVDFGEELRLEFGEEELQRWKDTGTIPNLMGGAARVKLAYAFYEDCLRQIAYEPATRIIAPTLIVQGDKDEHVPLHQSQRLFEALPAHKQMEMLPGADHQFTKSPDFLRMVQLLAEWMVRHLG
ncbi:MAG: prolyl oligopeptidase family serine peptidase, partial [Nitrospirae bacterium]|nr:prolyl oligopeptidase family serine peptidase [Nitrospirota bacterium]